MTGPSAPPVVVTMGEPAGIGGECLLRAWTDHRETLPSFCVIDDPGRLAALALSLKLDLSIQTITEPGETAEYFSKALPVLAVDPPLGELAVAGQPSTANAPAVIGAIDQAIGLVQSGAAAAMVTNPIHKAVLQDAGFKHPGHTEYLGHRSGQDGHAVMMLTGGGLRVVPVTVHLSLKDAVAALTTEAIVSCGTATAAALQKDFGIDKPRLAVAALNPHAGEDGKMGSEEKDTVAPAVATLKARGIDADGPHPADTLFHEDARQSFDAVLCMYHDQALIPLKTLDFYGGVNVTLGLPFVRTSPDHGTAFDIAGTGIARPDSLMAAIRLAAQMAARRHTA